MIALCDGSTRARGDARPGGDQAPGGPNVWTTSSGSMDGVTSQETTVAIDEELLAAARALAERGGRSATEVIEDAVRRYLAARGEGVVDKVWSRDANQDLTEEAALALAYAELRTMRQERRTAPPRRSCSG